MSIGDRIRKRREELGLSQESLSCMTGYKHRSIVAKWERDGSTLRPKKIEIIAQALRTTPQYLLGFTDESSISTGNKIKLLRQEKNITQKELGAELNLAESTISLYESDKRTPDNGTLIDIARFFGVSTDYLLGSGQDDMFAGERIKTLRKNMGISVETIAERSGLNRATIYRYENGDIEKISAKTLSKISEVLNTTPQYLLGFTGEDKEVEDMQSIPNGVDSVQMVSVIETKAVRGSGASDDPYRTVTQYWSPDGKFLAENDPINQNKSK